MVLESSGLVRISRRINSRGTSCLLLSCMPGPPRGLRVESQDCRLEEQREFAILAIDDGEIIATHEKREIRLPGNRHQRPRRIL